MKQLPNIVMALVMVVVVSQSAKAALVDAGDYSFDLPEGWTDIPVPPGSVNEGVLAIYGSNGLGSFEVRRTPFSNKRLVSAGISNKTSLDAIVRAEIRAHKTGPGGYHDPVIIKDGSGHAVGIRCDEGTSDIAGFGAYYYYIGVKYLYCVAFSETGVIPPSRDRSHIAGTFQLTGREDAHKLNLWDIDSEPLVSDGTFSGSGQAATRPFSLQKGLVRFEIHHSGDSHFAIWLLDIDGNRVDLLANTVGPFNGSKALGVKAGQYLLDVSSRSPWSVTISQ